MSASSENGRARLQLNRTTFGAAEKWTLLNAGASSKGECCDLYGEKISLEDAVLFFDIVPIILFEQAVMCVGGPSCLQT